MRHLPEKDSGAVCVDVGPSGLCLSPNACYLPAMPFRVLVFFAVLGELSAYAARPIHRDKIKCDYLLGSPRLSLADLIETKIVEPEGRYLFTPPRETSEHETRTTTILANRIGRATALIPTLSFFDMPAVDGIFFDTSGRPTMNFSLKTFLIPTRDDQSLNDKLRRTMRKAENSVNRLYSASQLRQVIASSSRQLGRNFSPEILEREFEVHAKVFGFDGLSRPVAIVIDYTLDGSAFFRAHSREARQVDGSMEDKIFLTLENNADGIDIKELRKKLRRHPSIKEYIFVGRHNIFHVTQTGWQMTEFCDDLGHIHEH